MNLNLFPAHETEFEFDALTQIQSVANNSNTISVAGMPDLHPGKCGPVGMAMLGKYPVPSLIGGDIGCGFSLFKLDLKPKKLSDQEWLVSKLDGLDKLWDGNIADMGFRTPCYISLGTIGLGNHFIEIQVTHNSQVDYISADSALLLIHTGSRGFGDSTYRDVTSICGGNILEDYEQWLSKHNQCVTWARFNRLAVAQRVSEALNVDYDLILDMPHNFVEKTDLGFLHRKGSSPSNRGLSILPGTRGTPTYLLSPLAHEYGLDSLPHGAGRRLSRSQAREGNQTSSMMKQSSSLSSSRKGSIIICGEDDLLLEERPRAYKDVNSVLQGTESAKLAVKVAEFHPVVTFKCSESHKHSKDKTRSLESKQRSINKRLFR